MKRILLLPAFIVSLTLFAEEQPDFSLVGYATLNGGTTGGAGGTSIVVTTGEEIEEAIYNKMKGNITGPLTIFVNGTITPANSSDTKINVKDVSNISILGVGTNGEFNGIGIKIWRANNIIIRNLKIHHVSIGDKDCIGIEGPASNIWIDHCELYNEFQGVNQDYYDGLFDLKRDVDYVTFSWNYLHDSWKASLSGSSDSDTHPRAVTYHHNRFENINSRLPLFRFGSAHLFNNYYKDVASTAINSRMGACAKIENNYFDNVQNPYVSAYSIQDGYGDISGNILVESPFVYSSDTRELQACEASIPYDYTLLLHPASDVPTIVSQYAGVGVIETYVVPETDANLVGITIGESPIAAFSSSQFAYSMELPYGSTNVPAVTAGTSASNATYVVSYPQSLPGDVEVTVTAEDGTNQKVYTITLTIAAPSTDAMLTSITLDGSAFVEFNSTQFTYDVELPFGTIVAPSVGATPNDSNALVAINQTDELPGVATIVVTAQDGETNQTYTISFTKEYVNITQSMISVYSQPLISIHPNPVNTSATLTVSLPAASEVELEVRNISGRLMLSRNLGLLFTGENQISVDASRLRPDFYLFMIRVHGEAYTARMLVR